MLPTWLNTGRLWLVTDLNACRPDSIPQTLELAIPAGIDVVVLRMKHSPESEFLAIARQSREICTLHDVPLVISHRPDIAVAVQADGIHLGQGDPPFPVVKARMSPSQALGYSCHSVAEAAASLDAGADYVFLGPIFATPEKLKYGDPLGTEVIADAAALGDRVVFIGGMNLQTIPLALAAGASRIAAIRAFQQPPDFVARIREASLLLEPKRDPR